MQSTIQVAPTLEVATASSNAAKPAVKTDQEPGKFAEALQDASDSKYETSSQKHDSAESIDENNQSDKSKDMRSEHNDSQNHLSNESAANATAQMAAQLVSIMPKHDIQSIQSIGNTAVSVTGQTDVTQTASNTAQISETLPPLQTLAQSLASSTPASVSGNQEFTNSLQTAKAESTAAENNNSTVPLTQNRSDIQKSVSATQIPITTAENNVKTAANKTGSTETNNVEQSSQTLQNNSPALQQAQLSDQSGQQEMSENKNQNPAHADQKASAKHANSKIDNLLSLSETSTNATRIKLNMSSQSDAITVPVAIKADAVVQKQDEQLTSKTDTGSINSLPGAFQAPVTDKSAAVEQTSTAQTNTTQPTELSQKIIDKVIKEVTLHKSSNRNDLVVRLDPPKLGTLQLHITQDASGISTKIVASSEQVRNLLNQHMTTLMTAMNEAGIKMDSMTVTTASRYDSESFTQKQGFGQAHSQAQSQFSDSKKRNPNYQAYAGSESAVNGILSSRSQEVLSYNWYA